MILLHRRKFYKSTSLSCRVIILFDLTILSKTSLAEVGRELRGRNPFVSELSVLVLNRRLLLIRKDFKGSGDFRDPIF